MPITTQNNFIYLLIGLLGILLLAPIVDYFGEAVSTVISNGSLLSALVIGIWSLVGSKLWFRASIVLAITAVSLTILGIAFNIDILLHFTVLVSLLFLVISTAITFKYVFVRSHVNINKIYGAVCIYLMMGIIWAIFYYFLVLFQPESFSGLGSQVGQGVFAELIYYSFVTLTTLGYGDITPIAPLARTLSYIESISGQIYLTVLVAALVGMHISKKSIKEQE